MYTHDHSNQQQRRQNKATRCLHLHVICLDEIAHGHEHEVQVIDGRGLHHPIHARGQVVLSMIQRGRERVCVCVCVCMRACVYVISVFETEIPTYKKPRDSDTHALSVSLSLLCPSLLLAADSQQTFALRDLPVALRKRGCRPAVRRNCRNGVSGTLRLAISSSWLNISLSLPPE